MQLHTHLHLHAYAYGHNLTGKLDLFEFFSNFPFDFQLIKSVLEITLQEKISLCMLSGVQLFAAPWSVACQVPLSKGFFRQEYWSGSPFPSTWIFLTQGSNLVFSISCITRQILYHCATWEAVQLVLYNPM